jgi:hypothetical protein
MLVFRKVLALGSWIVAIPFAYDVIMRTWGAGDFPVDCIFAACFLVWFGIKIWPWKTVMTVIVANVVKTYRHESDEVLRLLQERVFGYLLAADSNGAIVAHWSDEFVTLLTVRHGLDTSRVLAVTRLLQQADAGLTRITSHKVKEQDIQAALDAVKAELDAASQAAQALLSW